MAIAWVVLAEEYGRKGVTRERYFGERTTALEVFDDVTLIRKFRFPRSTILEIIELCQDQLSRPTKRNHAISVATQVLAALRFYAKGTFQEDTGDIVGVSQPAASQIVSSVTSILVEQAPNYIKFPATDVELTNTKLEFATLAGFPNVIGAVDGTHIFLRPTGPDEPLFVCRKGGHSINVQITCDKKMRITSIVSKYPGSTHDSFIWRNCQLRDDFIANPPNGWLLGDSGYGVEPWLITPLLEPQTLKEKNFNCSLKMTRYIVENTIGLWKSVFRCIDVTGGKLLYCASKICKIIVATAVLHNMRRALRLPQDDEFVAEEDDDNEIEIDMSENAITTVGNRVRKSIIERHF